MIYKKNIIQFQNNSNSRVQRWWKGVFSEIRLVIWVEDDLYAYKFYQSASALTKVTWWPSRNPYRHPPEYLMLCRVPHTDSDAWGAQELVLAVLCSLHKRNGARDANRTLPMLTQLVTGSQASTASHIAWKHRRCISKGLEIVPQSLVERSQTQHLLTQHTEALCPALAAVTVRKQSSRSICQIIQKHQAFPHRSKCHKPDVWSESRLAGCLDWMRPFTKDRGVIQMTLWRCP